MYNLTRPCTCLSGCKDMKLLGNNEFWIRAKPEGGHYTWAYCNCCMSRYHLDGTNEIKHDDDYPCNYCTHPDDLAVIKQWREANAA